MSFSCGCEEMLMKSETQCIETLTLRFMWFRLGTSGELLWIR